MDRRNRELSSNQTSKSVRAAVINFALLVSSVERVDITYESGVLDKKLAASDAFNNVFNVFINLRKKTDSMQMQRNEIEITMRVQSNNQHYVLRFLTYRVEFE